MSTSHQHWLLEQLPEWEREGLLTNDASRTLRERYPVDASQPGIAQIAMGSLGALLIGSGLIAILAFNWDDFTRPVRLLFAFLPLLLTQLVSLRVLQRGEAVAVWIRESAALLQTMTVGACIALVSQIYNMSGEWSDFLFWWLILSLPLAWLLRSHSVAKFYLIGIAVWSVNQADSGKPWFDSPLMYPLLLLGLLPLWPGLKGSATLPISTRWVMTVSAIFGFCSAAEYSAGRGHHAYGSLDAEAFIFLCTLTAAALVLLPIKAESLSESTGRKPQLVLGTLWLLGFGVVTTYRYNSRHVLDGVVQALQLPWCWGLLAIIVVFAIRSLEQRRWAVLAIATVAVLPMIVLPMEQLNHDQNRLLLSWLMTLHLAALGTTLIALELLGKVGAPRLGALLLSVLILARMGNSDLSLLAKGIGFIAVGSAFLAFNFVLSRRHRQLKTLTA